jgi:hypothetical protein
MLAIPWGGDEFTIILFPSNDPPSMMRKIAAFRIATLF